MSADPFSPPDPMTAGSQLARAWQDSMEAWWQALLGDPGRLSELARRLAGMGLGGGSEAADLQRVLEALELIEQRVERLEARTAELAENLALLVRHLGEADRGGRS